MLLGPLEGFGSGGYSVIIPLVVMRPMRLPFCSVNQSAPSGPTTRPVGAGVPDEIGNKVSEPEVVIRPIAPLYAVNQRLPSGLVIMTSGSRLPGTGNS